MALSLVKNFLFLQTGIPQYVVNSKFTASVITIAGALMLWFALFFMGIIAKRYEQVLHKKTDWQFIILSPTGILIYAVIQAYSLIVIGNLKMTDTETWIAYIFFFLSGFLSLIGSLRFFKVVMPHKGGSK
ncbi:MAG: hypothetical protein PHW02_07135 [bacterium]|nr:hypothetical protein [bacterium]